MYLGLSQGNRALPPRPGGKGGVYVHLVLARRCMHRGRVTLRARTRPSHESHPRRQVEERSHCRLLRGGNELRICIIVKISTRKSSSRSVCLLEIFEVCANGRIHPYGISFYKFHLTFSPCPNREAVGRRRASAEAGHGRVTRCVVLSFKKKDKKMLTPGWPGDHPQGCSEVLLALV